jgi:NAD(P)-dependent dehydrogenase (short-subunit alcohol dehydrogenase family)
MPSDGERQEIEAAAAAIKQLGRNSVALPLVDVTQAEEVERMVARAVAELGKVDILVNNAEVPFAKPILETSVEEWNKVIDVNLTSVFLCCKAAGRRMLEQGKGKIINIASAFADRGVANCTAYCASKGGIVQLTKALALEWALKNVYVNAIGQIWFDGAPGLEDENIRGSLLRYLPMRRFGQPDELGGLVVYLASSASDYITGETIFISGGIMGHI